MSFFLALGPAARHIRKRWCRRRYWRDASYLQIATVAGDCVLKLWIVYVKTSFLKWLASQWPPPTQAFYVSHNVGTLVIGNDHQTTGNTTNSFSLQARSIWPKHLLQIMPTQKKEISAWQRFKCWMVSFTIQARSIWPKHTFADNADQKRKCQLTIV